MIVARDIPKDLRDAANLHIGAAHAIGPLELSTNMLLAPVANYCDLAFRIVCRDETLGLGGLGLACTDLLSPQGLLRGTATSLDLARTDERDRPICMQLYGGDPDILSEGALWAVEHGADVIDINMGCPVDKVTKKDGGSMLLCHPERTVRTAERIVLAVGKQTNWRVPVTAKVRLGWDASCLVAPDLARELEKVGIRQVTVHGRTTEQKFKGEVDLAGIRDVVQAVDSIPVLGNGDLTEPQDVVTMMRVTGCRGVMIGRGAFSRPWLFRRAWALQTSLRVSGGAAGDAGPEPDEAGKVAIIRRYLDLMVEFRGEKYAMTHIRRRITWFGKALGPCKPLREAVRQSQTPADVHCVLDRFLAGELRVRGPRHGAPDRPSAACASPEEHPRTDTHNPPGADPQNADPQLTCVA